MDVVAERFVVALDRWNDRLLSDLKAIPDELRRISPGGNARSPYSVALECGVINTRLATVLEGVELPPMPEMDEFDRMLDHLQTFEAVAEFITHETLVLKIAVQNMTPSGWEETVTLSKSRPPMTRFDVILLAITHMAYHDGQLNVVHLLNGDSENHW